jgi:acyl-CoA thioester hydrolase
MNSSDVHKSITPIRVRYAETDRMGVAYHANYLVWFEVGRTDLIRELGYPYAQLESEGVFLPVIEAHCAYIKPVFYDNELQLHSQIEEQNGARLRIGYTLFRDSLILARGFTVHAFMDKDMKAVRPPEKFLMKILPKQEKRG